MRKAMIADTAHILMSQLKLPENDTASFSIIQAHLTVMFENGRQNMSENIRNLIGSPSWKDIE